MVGDPEKLEASHPRRFDIVLSVSVPSDAVV